MFRFFLLVIFLALPSFAVVTQEDIDKAEGAILSLDNIKTFRPLLPTEVSLLAEIRLAIQTWNASQPPPPPIPPDLTPELQATLESITP